MTAIAHDVLMHDLLNASIHEAGHHVVARHCGMYSVGIRLKVNAVAAEDRTQKAVAGHVCYIKHAAKLTARQRAIFGLAGEVAEHLNVDFHADAYEILEAIEDNWVHVSDSDRKAIGKLTWAKVRDTVDVLRLNWPEVEREAKWAREAFLAELGDRDGSPAKSSN